VKRFLVVKKMYKELLLGNDENIHYNYFKGYIRT